MKMKRKSLENQGGARPPSPWLRLWCFGDVVVFPTTYRTIRFNMDYALFVGVNHNTIIGFRVDNNMIGVF